MSSSSIKQLAGELLDPQPGARPQLPTVGRRVHFYNTMWQPEGPYAAIVSGVRVVQTQYVPEGIEAQVDLTVFSNDILNGLVKQFKDVPVLAPEEIHTDHNCQLYWIWPPRS